MIDLLLRFMKFNLAAATLALWLNGCSEPTYVIVMAGQSNMVGIGEVEEIDSLR